MSSGDRRWIVEITYPWELIELVRKVLHDETIRCLFLDTAGQYPLYCEPKRCERNADKNQEGYLFRDESRMKAFVDKVKRTLDNGSSFELQMYQQFLGASQQRGVRPNNDVLHKAIEKDIEKDKENKVVRQPYSIKIETHIEGRIGREL